MSRSASTTAAVWRRQGRVRDWFHTKAGAKFLNLQTAWFRIVAPKGYAVLTTVGWRSGKPRRSSVRAIRRGDHIYVVSITGRGTDWFHNLDANPEARLRIGRRSRTGRARQPRDDGEALAARAAYCDDITGFDFISSLVNQRGIPWPRRIREMHTRWFDEGELFVIELSENPGESDLLFAGMDGSPVNPTTVSRTFDRLATEAGLPRIRLHGLRHSWATLALREGIPTKVVAEILGHSSTSVTENVYQHVSPGMQADATTRVARLLDSAG